MTLSSKLENVGESLRVATVELFTASFILPVSGPPIEGGGVLVQDGKIVAVAPLNEIDQSRTSRVTEFPGCVIMPGLINAHTHLELTSYPLWKRAANITAPATTYHGWIREVITIKRDLSLADLKASLHKGLSLALASGTTMVGDILAERRLLPLYSNSSLSGRVYLEFLGRDPQRYGATLASLESDISLLPDNVHPGISPHTPFTLSEELFSLLFNKCRELSLPQAIHLAESGAESEFFRDSTGSIADKIFPFVGWDEHIPEPMKTTSTAWLAEKGWLSPALSAVHAVHVTDNDIDLLRMSGATVVICARSNHGLGVGKAPIGKFLGANIPLAIGTDSMATVSSLSMFDEIRFLLDNFPGDLNPEIALRLASSGGAKALRRSDCAGTLEAGKRADFIVIRPDCQLKSDKLCEQIINGPNIEAVYCCGDPARCLVDS